ncbi:MAG: VanZ family protein [Spartobacteria bacterium]|nr:VanZ family protein [Spartobacteria bacterium]
MFKKIFLRSSPLFWLPALIWALVIFSLSAWSGPDEPPTFWFPHLDKLVHMGIFGVLCLLILWPLYGHHHLSLGRAMLLALLMTSAYGALDEFHQSFTPHRSVEYLDWLADTVGAACACFFFAVLLKINPMRCTYE